jgi:hypothetical protein
MLHRLVDFCVLQITAGEQIDLMFGAKLGLSSMAAAGLGNTIADVVGINISHTIEVRGHRPCLIMRKLNRLHRSKCNMRCSCSVASV